MPPKPTPERMDFPPKCVLVACKIRNTQIKVSTLSPLPTALGPSGGDAVGERKRGQEEGSLLQWRNQKKLFFEICVEIGKWGDSEWNSLNNSNGVLLCSYACIYTPPHTTYERDMCGNFCFSWLLQEVQNSPQRMKEGPSSSKHMWG